MRIGLIIDVPDQEHETITRQLEHQVYGYDGVTTIELDQGISFDCILVSFMDLRGKDQHG